MSGSVEDLKNLLKNSKDSANNTNLYDHLTDTFMKILVERSGSSFDNFEKISSHVKENPLKFSTSNLNDVSDEIKQLKLNWTGKVSALLKVPAEPLALDVFCPDLLEDFNLLEWANISIGKSEVYQLNLSIRSLAATLPSEAERLRFFGKIFSKTAPYYIVEGLAVDDEDAEEIDESKQEGKNGVNKYSYWVSQSVSAKASEWIKLPNASIEQIVLAKNMDRFFSGKLDSTVPNFPPFPGTEKNFLRAKIAIILGSTAVSPEGFYDLDEDEDVPVAKRADDASMLEKPVKTSSDLKSSENWKHHELEINELGRITSLPEVDGDEPENADATSAEVPKPLDDLKASLWSFRVSPGGAGENDSSNVVARHLEWPGALTIANGKK